MNAIFKRTSVRKYAKKNVNKKQIEKLLRAGMAAPSAVNQQPWEFIVVTDKDLREKIGKTSPFTKQAAKAPLSIVLLMRTDVRLVEMAPQDMGACAENILLEATKLGLGAVWQGVYAHQERMGYLTELFGLDESVVPFAIISIGYPKGGKLPKQQDRFDESRIYRNGYEAAPAKEAEDLPEEVPAEDAPAEEAPAADAPTEEAPAAETQEEATVADAQEEVSAEDEPADEAPADAQEEEAVVGWRSGTAAGLKN